MEQLRIGVLDFNKLSSQVKKRSQPEIRMLRDAIEKLGHIPVVYRVDRCELFFNIESSEILYNDKPLNKCDVLIPRASLCSNIDLEISIIKQFQIAGIPVVNEYLPIARATNKLRMLQMLTQAGVEVPRTIVLRRLEFLDEAIDKVGGYPVVLKTPFGEFGRGVAIVESKRSLYSSLDVLWKQERSSIIIIQEFIGEAESGKNDVKDCKAIVVGDNVISAIKETDAPHTLSSLPVKDSKKTRVELTTDERKMVVQATKALGLHMAEVEFLRSQAGPLILDVNANPSFKGISKTLHIADKIVEYVASLARGRVTKKRKKS